MCVKAQDYLRDMVVRAKLQFEGHEGKTVTEVLKIPEVTVFRYTDRP